ncbi:MAG: DotI/IcmL family type IV secretion protein [Gammaproteobacteria bacterium]
MEAKQQIDKGPEAEVGLINDFYRDKFRTLQFSLLFLLAATVVSVLLFIGLFLYHPDNQYFSSFYKPEKNLTPAESNFEIVPHTPINKPNMDDRELFQWFIETVVHSFSFDSQRYPMQLSRIQNDYTPTAFKQLQSILTKLYDFTTLTSAQALSSILHPQGAPVLVNRGVYRGHYVWMIEIPVKVEFAGSVVVPPVDMKLTLLVKRISMEDDVYGLAIDSITASNVIRNKRPIKLL